MSVQTFRPQERGSSNDMLPSEVMPDCIEVFAAENGITIEEAKSLLGMVDQGTEGESPTDMEKKAFFLMESFPEVLFEDIQAALEECQGDEVRASELLLNEKFIAETEQAKNDTTTKSKSKKRSRNRKSEKAQLNETEEIARLSDSLNISYNDAALLYKKKGNFTEALFSTVPVVSRSKDWVPTAKPRASIPAVSYMEGADMSVREIKKAISDHNLRAEELRNQLRQYRESGDLKASHNRHLYQDKTNQINMHTQKAHELSLRLTQMQHSRVNHFSVDFHQLTVKEAEVVAHKQLDKWLDSPEQELVLITGLGSHSLNGVARIKPAIVELLRMRRIKYIDRGGSLVAIK